MVFHKIPHFLQLFLENLRILKHGSLHENLLVSAKSVSSHSFSQNRSLFATICRKLVDNPFLCGTVCA